MPASALMTHNSLRSLPQSASLLQPASYDTDAKSGFTKAIAELDYGTKRAAR